jgi:acetylornithine deacetylase
LIDEALAALDEDALLADASALVQVPSITARERHVMELFARLAGDRGLDAHVREHDLAVLRAHSDHPGEELERAELVSAVAVLSGSEPGAPRLALNGHLDVVEPGSETWSRDPWSGALEDGRLHGRGSVDMKGAVAAALHAVAAVSAAGGTPGDVVIHAVPSEEDGGLGTFAALQEDADFAAAVVVEPTEFDVACAGAGALTFRGRIPGHAAHAAVRLEGISALDRYMPVHAALAAFERELNADVTHPLMREHELPYPVSVGRLDAGSWASSVPDQLVFEGRVGVPIGMPLDDMEAKLTAVVREACPEAMVTWTGGRFGSAETPADHPLAQLALAAASDELGRPAKPSAVAYGADMRLYTEREIPALMLGTPGLVRAHTVDEYVEAQDLVKLARMLIRVIARFGA